MPTPVSTPERPVALGPAGADAATRDLLTRLPEHPRDVTSALAFAAAHAGVVPAPAGGRTLVRWEQLASLAAVDVQLARVLEPHLDATAILAEAGRSDLAGPGATWGVWAAEGPGRRLVATRRGAGWTLAGSKPWCSLARDLSHALVTAWVDEEHRGLFAVRLDRGPERGAVGEVRLEDQPWVARGLPDVRSTAVTFDEAPAEPVGAPGWYLQRPGFAHGGVGVAAVWFGGAVGVARRLLRPSPREPDQVALVHRGAVDVALHAARTVLASSATEIDAGRATGAAGERLAARARAVVAQTAEDVLARVDRALGPAPLTAEEDHAARTADLRLYLRQQHGERDAAHLGSLLGDEPW